MSALVHLISRGGLRSGGSKARSVALDHARGAAVLAMIGFHFCWDLVFLGLVGWDLMTAPWMLTRWSILATFLGISGVALALAAGDQARVPARRYLRRLGLIAGMAALVSLSTWLALDAGWIYFGVLHSLAAGAMILWPLLGWPKLAAALGLVLLALPVLTPELLPNQAWLAWTGVAGPPPFTVDYVPVCPWAGFVLIGYGVGRSLRPTLRLQEIPPVRTAPLAWLGRHSLGVYLLHQPVLIGLLLAGMVMFGRI